MKQLFALAAAFSLSAPAFATSPGEIDLALLEQALTVENTWDHHAALKGSCGEIKLTDEQKASLKTLFIGHKKAQIQAQANLKIAGLDYLVALTDSKGSKQTAETAAATLGAAKTKLATNHLGLAHEILFDVLAGDQRRPALTCMHQLHKAMKDAKQKKACAALIKKPAPKIPQPINPKPMPKPTPKP